MSETKSRGWHGALLLALTEPADSPRLSYLVKEAEEAICARLCELRTDATKDAERDAIREAMVSLRHLRDFRVTHAHAPGEGALAD
jgi:hypothetical protein